MPGPEAHEGEIPSPHAPYCTEPDKRQSGCTQDWRAAAPTLFIFMLAATYIMLQQDLPPGLPPTQNPCMPQYFTPTSLPITPLHLIAISALHSHLQLTHTLQHFIFFANILALGYAFASSWRVRIA